MATTTKTAAVAYVRMSSDKQEASPDQQRREIEQYAERHDYDIVAWYTDEGISGDDTERRVGFKRMVADAGSAAWRVILCWNQDRFGRFDLIEAGRWIEPLRKARVRLETVTQGKINWNDFAGRLLFAVETEAKHGFLRDLSKNVTRGQSSRAKQGKRNGGRVPFGYLPSPDGTLLLGQTEHVDLVRWIFTQYLGGNSLRGLCDQLNRNAIASPAGQVWTPQALRYLLRNPAYAGHAAWRRHRMGRYMTENGEPYKRKEAEWILVENTHPAIVDISTFNAAQEMLTRYAGTGGTRRDENEWLLSGLLYCGGCGGRMSGTRENGELRYLCNKYRTAACCGANRVDQGFMVTGILGELKRQYYNDAVLDELRLTMRKLLADQDRPAAAVQREHLADTEHKLAQAQQRLLEVPADMVHIVVDRIRELEQLRARQLATVKAASCPHTALEAELDTKISAALERFQRLEGYARDGNTLALRDLLRSIVARVEVFTSRELCRPGGRNYRYTLERAVIYFQGIQADPAESPPGKIASSIVARGDKSGLLVIEWIPTIAG